MGSNLPVGSSPGPPHIKAKHALGMHRLARSFWSCDQPCLKKSKAPSTNVNKLVFEHGFEPKLFRFDVTRILEPKFNSGTQVWNLGFALSLGSIPGLDLGLDIDEGTPKQTVTTFSPLSRSRGVGSVAGHWPVRQRMLSGGSKTN